MIKYPIWFTCSLRSFWCLNVTGPFWAFLMEKWHLNIIQNFPTEIINLTLNYTVNSNGYTCLRQYMGSFWALLPNQTSCLLLSQFVTPDQVTCHRTFGLFVYICFVI